MTTSISTLLAKRGLQSLICLLLAVLAIYGLWSLDSQVQVFSFGDVLYDAQFFPRIVLSLIIVTAVLCCLARLPQQEEPIGSFAAWARVLLGVGAVGLALWLMPNVGFLLSAFLAAVVIALTLGERHLALYLGLPLLVATLVTVGAQHGLNIPLP